MTDQRQATRREFLKTTTAAAAGTALAANLTLLSNVHAAGSDVIRVGLVGCGGRGTGAAENVLNAAPNVHIVALADVFKDRLDGARGRLEKLAQDDENIKKLGNKVEIKDDHCFLGLDAYEKLLGSDINYVILATPPGFRPIHLQAAVAAGKTIFTEKPVGVDGPGIRKVLAAYEEAQRKGLHIAAGTQRRHQAGYIATIKQIHEGALGDITSARCYWNQGGLWQHDREPSWSDVEWQIRNWLYFTWLSGDHICEQHVHNLDVINWALGGHPLRALSLGGRQVRTGPQYGMIYDHFATEYEYPNNVHVLSQCRQIDNCDGNVTPRAGGVSEAVQGTKGFCQVNHYTINRQKVFSGEEVNPYVQEHTDLIESVRSGKPLNELKNVAETTLTAVLGRLSAYTGKLVTWEQALHSKWDLMPKELTMDMSLPVAPVAMPGITPLV
ncbi:MAG: Gfo/Idh/MocA family oxidoreductase [Planctomycetes bacterium]|nr:Gfo/Idh/MocA family oxidoreductase [Planctomycetota bacterium]